MSRRDPVLFALILAAGGSRRLGSPKQLLRHGGEALVQRSVRLAAGACGERSLLVLGADYSRVLESTGEGLRYFVVNEHWQQGLASSLTLGLSCLPGDWDGVLVLLADQPLVDAADLERLGAAWRSRPDAIAVSRYDGYRNYRSYRSPSEDRDDQAEVLGVPAIFPRRLLPELRELTGDRGARSIIERYRQGQDLVTVDCAHAAVDIDTPEDTAILDTRGGK